MHDYTKTRNEKGETLEEFLASYDPDRFKHQSSTVDMIVMTVSQGQLKLLLIKRRNHPFIGCWATPGGFVGFGEDLDAAALRELQEETGIADGILFKQLFTFGKADRDPRTHVISTAYFALVPETALRSTAAGDDAAQALWFTVCMTTECETDTGRTVRLSLANREHGESIQYRITETAYGIRYEIIASESTNQLAGDHKESVYMAVDEVMRHALSSGMIFNMVPNEFTLDELRTCYEGIVGHAVDHNTFRAVTAPMLITVDETKGLYQRNAMYKHTDI